jgi:hypothetical protein
MEIFPFTETNSFAFFIAIITTTLALATINGRLLDQRLKLLTLTTPSDSDKRSLKHIMWTLKMVAILIMSQLFLSVSLLGRILLSMAGKTFWEVDFLLVLWQGGNIIFWIRIFSQYYYHTFIDPNRRRIPDYFNI